MPDGRNSPDDATNNSPNRWLPAVRVLFYAAAGLAFAGAVSPGEFPPALRFTLSDKFEHIIAFYCLGVLGALAHPRARLVWIGIGLALFGGLIEIVQGIPGLNRDRDILDWIADVIAILCALGPFGLSRLRLVLAEARTRS